MNNTKEIISLKDIKELVDTFYEKVIEDKLIGTIFNERILDRWPQHLEKMYTFCQTLLLEERTYFGSPFPAKPIKRNEHIIKLSKDHYSGLLKINFG